MFFWFENKFTSLKKTMFEIYSKLTMTALEQSVNFVHS